jgi:Domain of unknown function (DUF4349)
MARFKLFLTVVLLVLAGCSAEEGPFASKINTRNYMLNLEATRTPAPSRGEFVDGGVAFRKAEMGSAQPSEATATPQPPEAQARPIPERAGISRKVIYDAQVDLVVDRLDPIAKKVVGLVQDARAYIAEQSITGSPGSLRSMRWKIRVPVEHFESFVTSIVALGELVRNDRTSQDITEQYYDIDARLKNKKLEEQTISKILQERSGKLEDVLKIEIELSRVRGEIEQLEGRIRLLENLSSLASVTLSIHEREEYAPPPPVVADFRTQISRTWDSSILAMVNLGKAIVLWAVGSAIWIPLWVIGAIVAWFLVRWLVRVFIGSITALFALARAPIRRPRAPTGSG